ncbi:general stress protein 16U [Abditibacteriota bacterium]|nr:general stress protein 16U [Abditibacteriota bacterium]
MPTLTRGQKVSLANSPSRLQAASSLQAPGLTLDFSCFGVDGNGKLSDDRFFVFYNQKEAPQGAIRLVGDSGFDLDLDRLPTTIQKLVFVVTVDGGGEMSQITRGSFALRSGTQEIARFDFQGSDFGREKAVMIAEIYRRDGWRLAAVGQGFAGGLSAVLKHYGGQEVQQPAPTPVKPTTPPPSAAPPSSSPKISLDKDKALQLKLEKSAPQLVNLSKTLAVSLDKKGLKDIVARVALVLDASGSMTYQYEKGNVQGVVDRIATLAMRLDDDGELDTWGFASRHARLPSVSLANVNGYVKEITKKHSFMSIIGNLGVNNNEPPVMREILQFYWNSPLPAFVVFISDGGVGSSNAIKEVLIEASRYPIFWQFVGLGGSNYGILEDLDTMRGRTVDNANFFPIDDWNRVSDAQLYDRLLNEFPQWLRAAKSAGILR